MKSNRVQMTFEQARNTANQLKHEFVTRLSVELSGRSLDVGLETCPSLVAYWLDGFQRINGLSVVTYAIPWEREPDEPLILRITANLPRCFSRLSNAFVHRMGWDLAEVDRRRPPWALKIYAMPEELPRFVPWVADLAVSHTVSIPRSIAEPPCQLRLNGVEHWPATQYALYGRQTGWTLASADAWNRHMARRSAREWLRRASQVLQRGPLI
ncbi:MAG: hypothetical protein AMXMBFR33_53580 [Candidatus Xenobia bacterium]